MTDIDTLISEINSAGAEREKVYICDALDIAVENGWISKDRWRVAMGWCGAGAYLSAAEVLVPPKLLAKLEWTESGARAFLFDSSVVDAIGIGAKASTPALALVTASMKALAAQMEDAG